MKVCYNKIGICAELCKNLLYKAKDGCYYIDIPKPMSDIEMWLITEFIYGVNIGIKSLTFIPLNDLCSLNKTIDKLTIEDYRKSGDFAQVNYELTLRHLQYFDSNFNNVLNAYDLDNIVRRTFFGNMTSRGNIVNNVEDFYRIKEWVSNRKLGLNIAREDFLDSLTNLKKLNRSIRQKI
jgi:hypothetical protein